MRCTLFLLVFVVSAFAAPSGFQSASATYHVDRSGAHVITSGNKAIIHWTGFSLGKGEVVKFLQANGQSAVLNRVKGPSISKIYGHIESNGKVFLLNGSGVLIGSEGRIDCAGFLASTANIPNSDFLAGRELAFKNFGKGDIINLGTIECPGGDVVLLAKCVENSGSITAGNIYLASGTEVLLKPDGPISIQSSLGKVRGAGPYELAIKTEGKIVSQTLNEEGGKIFLISERGKTEANGTLITSGGTIHILGEEVVVGENAFIDVSADHGAGEILIGGDTQGRNPHIKNAYITTTKKGGEIHADSYVSGDAGKIIVWSDTDTVAAALATARAFGDSGNGGFIEASGGHGVATPTFPILTSKNGRYGTFLIDAGAITIDSSGGTGPKVWGAGPLSTALGGMSILVDTGADGVVGGDQTITITGGATTVVSWSAPTTLTLLAGRSINMVVDTVIENTYAGSDSFDAIVMTGKGMDSGVNWDGITISGTVESTKGDIRMTGTGGDTGNGNLGIVVNSTGKVNSLGTGSDAAAIFLTGTGGPSVLGTGNAGITIAGSTAMTHATVSSDAGPISVIGTGGSGTENDNRGINVVSEGVISSTSGDVTVVGTGGASGADFNRGIFLRNDGSAISSGAGTLSITGIGGGIGEENKGIFINSSALISSTTGSITVRGTASGDATGDGNSGITLANSGDISTTSGNMTLIGIGGAKGVDRNHGIESRGNGVTITSTAGGAVTLIGTAKGTGLDNKGVFLALSSVVSSTTGAITLHGTGSADATGNVNTGIILINNPVISTTSGDITLTGIGGTKGLDSNSGIQITSADAKVTSTAGGTITLTGTGGGTGKEGNGIRVDSSASLSTTTGDITLHGTGSPDSTAFFSEGVQFFNGSSATTTTGDITVTGIASPMGTNSNDGVEVGGTSATLSSTAGGSISLTGTGGGAGDNNIGVRITNTGEVSTTTGSITLNGTAGSKALGDNNRGVLVETSAKVSTTSGRISLLGTGAPNGADNNDGVSISSEVSSTSGQISLTGFGGGTGRINNGVEIVSTGTVSSSNRIAMNGTGSFTGTDNNHGILVDGIVSGLSGELALSGVGGGSSSDNNGIQISSTAAVTHTSSATASLIGSAGVGTDSFGVLITDPGASVTSTGGGALNIQAFSDIVIQEGTLVTSSGSMTLNASTDLVIKGADASAINTRVTATGDATLIAGRNLSILDGTMSIPTITAGGNMTLVADNQFPSFPNRGPGKFTAQSSALITAAGELRVYTVRPQQNTISAPLNGATFTAGPFNVDTNTEKWLLYFKDGPYGGPSFTIYYKEGLALSEIIASSISISQLSLPSVQFGQLPANSFSRPSIYSGHFCPCDEEFSPYRSFIFEDDIYWTNSE